MTVSILPLYRLYYVYLCPPAERRHVLPQLLSMYAMTFYFGSITRYRPHRFDLLLRGPFGPRVRDFDSRSPRSASAADRGDRDHPRGGLTIAKPPAHGRAASPSSCAGRAVA